MNQSRQTSRAIHRKVPPTKRAYHCCLPALQQRCDNTEHRFRRKHGKIGVTAWLSGKRCAHLSDGDLDSTGAEHVVLRKVDVASPAI